MIIRKNKTGGGGGWAYRGRKEGRSRPAAARPDRAVKIVNGERMLARGDYEGGECVGSFGVMERGLRERVV